MSIETLQRRNEHEVNRFSNDGGAEVQDPINILVLGGGANSRHGWEAGAFTGPEARVDFVDYQEPQFPVAPERSHNISTPEGRARLERLVARGAFQSVYISIPAAAHASAIKEYLGHVAEGHIQRVVATKPAVRTTEEMRAIRAMVQEVTNRLAEAKRTNELDLGDTISSAPDEEDFLFVHEHYTEKGAWLAIRDQFTEVTKRLGRLRRMTSTISEARTIEEEGRTLALEDGVLEDFKPHFLSQLLDIQDAINANPRYEVPNRSRSTVERFRYEGSELRDGVETGFRTHGNATLIDHETNTEHEIEFICQGSKGATDNKTVVFEFENPDAPEDPVTITVDLRANTLEVPESVRDLFPEIQFTENGYGRILQVGLTENPGVLQTWKQAEIVIKMMAHQIRQSRKSPVKMHAPGTPIEELV